MTESEQPKAPEHIVRHNDGDENGDTEGHIRIAFDGDEEKSAESDQQDDTEGHVRY